MCVLEEIMIIWLCDGLDAQVTPQRARHRVTGVHRLGPVLIWKDRSSTLEIRPVGMWARACCARVQGREAAGISTGSSFSHPVI